MHRAQIYGIDFIPDVIFQEDRIETFVVDMRKEEDLKKMIERTGTDLDLVIDDGPHNLASQIFVARTVLPLLDKKTIYIVEDVTSCRVLRDNLPEYDVEIIRLVGQSRDNNLVVVRKK